ncbi:MAG: type II toxin-antitoxin system RelE/ParE family toxin [Betaproteobacteria bacterium]|nr:type II toxin-antitoxin system RelE/ParE family toxin [Betaproteobacteria bacterium]
MPGVVYAPRALRDLERLRDFLAEHDTDVALAAAHAIADAVAALERHPLIGRTVENGLRELVISRGRTGYVALYDYLEIIDAVVILAVRHQRESGFAQDK